MHSKNPGWNPGNHWCECDICGFDYRASQMRTTWDGKLVCIYDWEPRHPQEVIRAIKDTVAAEGIVTGVSDPVYESFTKNANGDIVATTLTIVDADQDNIPTGTFTNSL